MKNQDYSAEFTVIDDELPSPQVPMGASASPIPSGNTEEEALSVAQLAQDIASEAAKLATISAMKEARKLAEVFVGEAKADIKKYSDMYAKPQNLCLHIKLGELPPVKLKNRPAKVLPEILAQAKIGQMGGNWPLMLGPTGSGKTVAAEQLATAMKLSFDHVNCSEGMSETWLWGRQTPNGFIPGGLWKAFKDGGVFLADEADAANDNVWLSMNTMLANGHAHNPICGETVSRHENFIFVAAANTNGKGGTGAYTGRTRLDGATLNRFAMFGVEYDPDLERELCADKELLEILWGIRVSLTDKKSQDVISTRDIKNAYLQRQAGFPLDKILKCLSLRMDKSNQELFIYKEPKASKKKGA